MRTDRTGRTGPTPGQARGPRWRQVASGWYVPSTVDGTPVEQRILEQSVRLSATGALTGWAALRWHGATFFDGTDQGGRQVLPVPLLVGVRGNPRPDPRVALSWEQFPPPDRTVVAGVPCATPARALFDEVRRTRRVWASVAAVDMAAAAGLVTVAGFAEYVAAHNAWTGVPHARKVVPLAVDQSRSPQETRLRLMWVLTAGLPAPLCNQPVFDLGGRLLGYPDLLDPVAGLVGEYDGADHVAEDRRRADRRREERFRDHGLEYVVVVRGEFADPAALVRRLHAARGRSRFLHPDQRAWTLSPPPGFVDRLNGSP